mgnify:CR=1 FL=1
MEEAPWRRHQGGGIMEEESCRRHPGDTQETQEAPRRHPGDTQETQETQEAPRRHPGGHGHLGSKMCQKHCVFSVKVVGATTFACTGAT